MALRIDPETCIACGVCEPECPNGAIVDDDGVYRIRCGLCTECVKDAEGPRCRSLCPIEGCITVHPARQESRRELELKAVRLALRRGLDIS